MNASALNSDLTVDVFCRVIDNFGDAGVCLRLARQLVAQHGCTVRLFCDQPDLLWRLDGAPVGGLSYLSWGEQRAAQPARSVISGFGCELEPPYLQAMAALPLPPRWLHLDYLSAEAWVEGTHGLDSRHPRLGLVQRFFYPGFTQATGGLLREADCAPPWSEADSLATLVRYGITPAPGALRVLVFAYEYADFAPLVAASRECAAPVQWLICLGAACDALAAQLGAGAIVHRLPFVSQQEFDALLRSAHRAWVRGEDSAIRALWAGVPSVWQFYAQEERLHLIKMQAYLQRMASALALSPSAGALGCIERVHQAANGELPAREAQTAWLEWLTSSQCVSAALAWRGHLMGQLPSLADVCADYALVARIAESSERSNRADVS